MCAVPTRVVDWLQLIRTEFREPSDLRLTIDEACERWPLDRTKLAAILDVLVDVKYLVRSDIGVYSRSPAVVPDGERYPSPWLGEPPPKLARCR